MAGRILRGMLVWALAGYLIPTWAQGVSAQKPSSEAARNPSSQNPSGQLNGQSTHYNLDIPRLPLVDALNEFCRQTGLQYGYLPASTTEETTIVGPVKGQYTAEAALIKLLAPTGLMLGWTNANTFSVGTPRLAKVPDNGAGVNAKDSVSVAKDQPRSELRNRPEPLVVAVGGSGGSSAHGPNDEQLIHEVIVTGSRMQSIGGEGPMPVTVFNREKIDELGVSSVSDILKYIPQQPYTRTEGFRTSGAQFAELRGLGVDTTLILINGRRTVSSAGGLTANAFDLNTIPISAVERVEVLSDSASAVYGADAMGGVLNIILKKDIPQPALDLNYGTAEGGAGERRASLSAGYFNERLRGSFILDYFDRDFLLGEERDRWRNQDFRRYGSADRRSLNANPGNVMSRTAANLPGLPSQFAAVPDGSTGVGLTSTDFLATAGQRNLDSLYRYWSITPEVDRRSAAAFVELDLAPDTAAFGELLYVDRETAFQMDPSALSPAQSPLLSNATVPATNAFNPFGTAVTVNYLFSGIGPRQFIVESELFRAVAGLRGALNAWSWELSFLRTEEDASAWTENNVSAARVNAALASSDPNQALNVFQDGPGGSPELLASLVGEPVINRYSSESAQGAGFLRGPMFTLPTGTADAVIGGEWRKEDVQYDETVFGSTSFGSHHRTISAAFAELRLPLVRSDAQRPALKELALTLAGRLDRYSDFGDIFNPQYGVVWRPVADLAVRATYGTSFRPPSLFELFAPRIALAAPPIPDSRRNDEVVSTTAISGGNPDLDPIEAKSLTTGIVFTPRALEGLRVTGSYWQIKLQNRIAFIRLDHLLAHEASFPDLVVREEPTPADVAAGLPGRLVSLDVRRINFGRLETNGVDFSASYALDTGIGRFTPSVSATWVHEFTTDDFPLAVPDERVGVASLSGTIAKWRVVAALGWKRNALSLSATARYVPAYDDATAIGRTGRIVPSQTIVDAQGSLDFDEVVDGGSPWSGFKMTAGIANLFDEEPHFAEIGNVVGYDLSQGDLKQRFGYLKLSKKF